MIEYIDTRRETARLNDLPTLIAGTYAENKPNWISYYNTILE